MLSVPYRHIHSDLVHLDIAEQDTQTMKYSFYQVRTKSSPVDLSYQWMPSFRIPPKGHPYVDHSAVSANHNI
ncbi:hypothetical protein TSUD_207660 [Trifolium subterraneum]|uniref:Uncharacterized protein n=1 Tax=Trifolium subterraneum TaxID=3900 RepID=A0A2Z6NH88_TRISU|nr:hypothetical protein TSUD_207660 [Trifolium subterraneum]